MFSTYAQHYDRLQPIRIEMYRFYHELALDFMPFGAIDEFRLLELGCGTGAFLTSVLETYPNVHCTAFDYSEEMLDYAAQKVSAHAHRVTFRQRDLNEGLPPDLGRFQMVSAFSTIHHLTDENKERLFRQIHEVLAPGGWFFLIDAMSVQFDDTVFALGRRRQQRRLQERLHQAGIAPEEAQQVEAAKAHLDDGCPEKDRIAPLAVHLAWLKAAGFASVDAIWHFWMEHFLIARKGSE